MGGDLLVITVEKVIQAVGVSYNALQMLEFLFHYITHCLFCLVLCSPNTRCVLPYLNKTRPFPTEHPQEGTEPPQHTSACPQPDNRLGHLHNCLGNFAAYRLLWALHGPVAGWGDGNVRWVPVLPGDGPNAQEIRRDIPVCQGGFLVWANETMDGYVWIRTGIHVHLDHCDIWRAFRFCDNPLVSGEIFMSTVLSALRRDAHLCC